MKTEDLYAEVPCPRCGKNRLKSSSFCPHCGHVHEESWLDRLRGRLGGEGIQRPNSLVLAVALLGLGVAAVLAAAAIAEGRYRDLIAIAVIAALSIRAFLRLRKGTGPAHDAEPHDAPDDGGPDREADPSTPHYSCEKCGTTVRSDATECPKCGTRFA